MGDEIGRYICVIAHVFAYTNVLTQMYHYDVTP